MEMVVSGGSGELPTHSVKKEGKNVSASIILSFIMTAFSVQSWVRLGFCRVPPCFLDKM